MAKVSILNIDNVDYDIEDLEARNSIKANSAKINQLDNRTTKNEKDIAEVIAQGISAIGVDKDKVPTANGDGTWDWQEQKGSSSEGYFTVEDGHLVFNIDDK